MFCLFLLRRTDGCNSRCGDDSGSEIAIGDVAKADGDAFRFVGGHNVGGAECRARVVRNEGWTREKIGKIIDAPSNDICKEIKG